MIDYFALGLTHALILLALIRIAGQRALDHDPEFEDDRAGRRGRPERSAIGDLPGPIDD